MAVFFNWIGYFNGLDKRKKKLTDIGLFGFSWIGNGWFAVSTHYDSDMGYGAGITLTY